MKSVTFKNISFGYKKNKIIFRDLSFEITQPIGRGFVIGMMGSSGSGKSTILKLILGIEKATSGVIEIVPQNAVISYVPQEPILFEHLTPIENAEYFSKISNYKSKFNRELFNEVMEVLQIEDVLKYSKSTNEISGGQRQRIALLRALSIQPDILLLDEPLTGLDEEVKDQFLQTLIQLIQRFNLLVIYVTHHPKEVEYISDVIAYLVKEKKADTVSQVKLSFTKDFFNTPPTISALNATKELRLNTLQFRLLNDGAIEPIDPSALLHDKDIFLMSFEENVIHFSNSEGFPFELAAKTGLYSILKLPNSEIVFTVDNQTLDEKENQIYNRMLLTGEINIYDSKGQFVSEAEIHKNKILNTKQWQSNNQS